MSRQTDREDAIAYLAEGVHTAFRKAIDGHGSARVWDIIRHMPNEVWHDAMLFVFDGLIEAGIVKKKFKKGAKS